MRYKFKKTIVPNCTHDATMWCFSVQKDNNFVLSCTNFCTKKYLIKSVLYIINIYIGTIVQFIYTNTLNFVCVCYRELYCTKPFHSVNFKNPGVYLKKVEV